MRNATQLNQKGYAAGKVRAGAAVAIAALALSLALPLAAQRDTRVLQRNLVELIGDSYTIVKGRVKQVKAEAHPQIPDPMTVVVTLQVSEVWKGTAGQEFTFRAFVNHPADFKARLGYGEGQEVVLMLTQPSQYGLSSPAGLEQGRFRVVKDATGKQSIVNGLNNAGLFFRVAKVAPKLDAQLAGTHARQVMATHSSGPIPFDEFKTIVQTVVRSSQQ